MVVDWSRGIHTSHGCFVLYLVNQGCLHDHHAGHDCDHGEELENMVSTRRASCCAIVFAYQWSTTDTVNEEPRNERCEEEPCVQEACHET